MRGDGNLVELDEKYRLTDSDPNDDEVPRDGGGNWEEWSSGMDGFGGLVMLAASLVG